MATDDSDFFKFVVERKIEIENIEHNIQNQIDTKARQIEAAGTENPNIEQWRREMADLQKRNVSEAEDELRLLCVGIAERTGSNEILKRNTEATNRNLKGEKWAKYVLA